MAAAIKEAFSRQDYQTAYDLLNQVRSMVNCDVYQA